MDCKCIDTINAKLSPKNLKLVGYSFMMPSFRRRLYINTAWLDKEKAPKGQKKHPPAMLVSFCPFCGKKVQTKKVKEAKGKNGIKPSKTSPG